MNTLRDGMVQLNIPIPEDLRDKLDELIIKRCGYTKRGILGDLVTQAIREFVSKRDGDILDLDHAHTQESKENTRKNLVQETIENPKETISYVSSSKRKSKYDKLIDTIKRYTNNQKQISTGLAKKAIKQTIGNDDRTIDKYLKLLQENDILYPDSKLGLYDVQSWVLEDYRLPELPIKLDQVPELEFKKQ